MSAEHRCETRRLGVETQLREVMNHVDQVGADFDDVGGGKLGRPWSLVVVASDGADRSDGAERVENRSATDVPAMDDELATAKGIEGLGTDEPVRVRDHADDVLHGQLATGRRSRLCFIARALA